MRKSLKLLAAMLGSFALTIFLFRHQNSDANIWASVFFMMLLIYTPFGFPTVGAFIAERPRATFWTGVVVTTGGLAAMFCSFSISAFYGFPGGITGADPISMAVIWVMMAGLALTILPRSMAALKRSEKAAATLKSDQPRESEFHGMREARDAVFLVIHNWAPFLRLVGPWIVLLWAVPFVGLHIAAFHNGIAPSLFAGPVGKVDAATELVGERLPTMVASAFVFPIALVGWHRYILTGGASKLSLITLVGVTARYLWRLWMIVLLYSTLLKLVASNAPDIAMLLGTPDKLLVAELLFWSMLCVEVYLGCSFALVFPAVAVGNRNFLGMDSVRMSKPLGNSFRVGFVLSLLPFGLAWWGVVEILDRIGITGPRLSLAGYSFWLAPTAIMFLALASCATYLSRVYATPSKEHSNPIGIEAFHQCH